jgi:hypothetical protein
MLFTIFLKGKRQHLLRAPPFNKFFEVQRIGVVVAQAAPDSGIAADDARGPEKAPSFRAQNPFNSFVSGFG